MNTDSAQEVSNLGMLGHAIAQGLAQAVPALEVIVPVVCIGAAVLYIGDRCRLMKARQLAARMATAWEKQEAARYRNFRMLQARHYVVAKSSRLQSSKYALSSRLADRIAIQEAASKFDVSIVELAALSSTNSKDNT